MGRFALCCFVITAFFLSPPFATAYKVGYEGIPVIVDDLPAVHEKITSEGVRRFCEEFGLEEVKNSPIASLLFDGSLKSCEELSFGTDMGDWSSRMKSSPIKGVLLGSRFPDLREMAGIDSNMMDYVVVKHDKEVQVDAYRIDPIKHGQVSKYHNVFGGDMALGGRVFRDYAVAAFYELLNMAWSQKGSTPHPNTLVAANAMTAHDTGASKSDLLWEVPWSQVLLGVLCHAYEDAVSHDPLIVLDIPGNRIVFAALFYGKFTDEFGNERSITDLYEEIDPEMVGTTDGLAENSRIVRHTPAGPLDINDIAEFSAVDGEQRANFFTREGQAYASGHLVTSLAVYAVAELLGALHEASLCPDDPFEVSEILGRYLDKWVNFDVALNEGYAPAITQNIGAYVPEYEALPWYNYGFVDLWKHSGLADRTVHGKGAFYLPWSDPASMDGMLASSFTSRFVVQQADFEDYDEGADIFWLDRKKLYLFGSWFRADDVTSVDLEGLWDSRNYSDVEELEVDPDGGARGLDRVHASAWIPPGYRACIHSPPDPSAGSQGPRAAAYDATKELYRCFYGGEEGQIATINFHIRGGSTLHVLPIDPDGDGVPYLRGYSEGLYADNCPAIANPSQADGDGDLVGDACDECPHEKGSFEAMGCPERASDTDPGTGDEKDSDFGPDSASTSNSDSNGGAEPVGETREDEDSESDIGGGAAGGAAVDGDGSLDADEGGVDSTGGCVLTPRATGPRRGLTAWLKELF